MYRENPVARMDLLSEIPKRIRKIGDITYPEQREIYGRIGLRARGSTILAGAGLGVGAPYFDSPVITDISEEHAAFISAIYPFATVDIWDISQAPYGESFDNVVAVEVIEHCATLDCLDHLRATGRNVWFSTPNRNSRQISDDGPRNRYHVREYTPAEILAKCPAKIRDWRTWEELGPDTTLTPLVYECSNQ